MFNGNLLMVMATFKNISILPSLANISIHETGNTQKKEYFLWHRNKIKGQTTEL